MERDARSHQGAVLVVVAPTILPVPLVTRTRLLLSRSVFLLDGIPCADLVLAAHDHPSGCARVEVPTPPATRKARNARVRGGDPSSEGDICRKNTVSSQISPCGSCVKRSSRVDGPDQAPRAAIQVSYWLRRESAETGFGLASRRRSLQVDVQRRLQRERQSLPEGRHETVPGSG